MVRRPRDIGQYDFEKRKQTSRQQNTLLSLLWFGKKAGAVVGKLSSVVRGLTTLGQPPTAEQKVEKIEAGLEIGTLKIISVLLTLLCHADLKARESASKRDTTNNYCIN
jgi:hypothetical protein